MATGTRLEEDRQTFLDRFWQRLQTCIRIISTGNCSEERIMESMAMAEGLKTQLGRVRGQLISEQNADELCASVQEVITEATGLLGKDTVSTGYQPPRQAANGRGAEKFLITKEQLQFFISIGMTAATMADALQVSRSTICRRLREYDLKLRQKYASPSDQELDTIIRSAIGGNQKIGAGCIKAKLEASGVVVQRQRVRESVLRVDPVGVAMRALQPKLQRSVYSVAGPNSLWHIDGNHKLIRYGIVIHGGIDGKTRLMTFLGASNNNLATTVLENFTKAAATYGMPSRIRVDQGVENADICLLIELMRGSNRGSAIRGKSCHNQRIERAWVDVWNGVTNVYYTMFHFLETKLLLDLNTELDIWILQFVYLPRINADLEMFCRTWNCHGLSTEQGKSPMQLFTLGMLQNHGSQLTAVRDVFDGQGIPADDVDTVTSDDLERLLGRTRVEVPRIDCPLSTEGEQELRATINPLQHSEEQGMDLYVRARVLAQHLRGQ